jgi:hypothetical protein
MLKSLLISEYLVLVSNLRFSQSKHSGRLSEILRHQAALLEHIVTDQRYYSDYFPRCFLWQLPCRHSK